MRMFFRNSGLLTLKHSAKGSTWDKHKYVKEVDGKYYYPDSYEGGRHISSLSNEEVEKKANETIRGDYGNGQDRKDILGENYQQIQNRVNEILGHSGSTKMSDVSSSDTKEAEKKVAKAVSKSKGLDFETIYKVYRK